MKQEEAKILAEEYVQFFLQEWSNLPHQAQLDTDGQRLLIKKREQIERDSNLPVGRVGEILRVPVDYTSQWVCQVEELIIRRSTLPGRVVDDVSRKLLKIKF